MSHRLMPDDALSRAVGAADAARSLINQIYPGRGRLLHVGGGDLGLVASLKADGWRVHCIDADPSFCQSATQRHGIAAHPVSLEAAAIPGEAFDVVIARSGWGDPEALALINRILRPGGHCLIDRHMADPLALTDSGFRAVPGQERRSGIWPIPAAFRAAPQPKHLWLQKIAAMPGAAAINRQDGVAVPAWLREVAGVVTTRASNHPDIRGGYPWRLPDCHGRDPTAALPQRSPCASASLVLP